MTLESPCLLHEAVLVSTRGASRAGQFEPDPSMLLEYDGPDECPPSEDCPRICDLARRYRLGYRSLSRNEEIPEGEHPAELWRQLIELVRATPEVP